MGTRRQSDGSNRDGAHVHGQFSRDHDVASTDDRHCGHGIVMDFAALKVIGFRVVAFASTLMMSLAIVGSLPKFKERRKKYFLEAATDGNVNRMQWLHLAGVSVNARGGGLALSLAADRKSTRLNSSHEWISYAVFCLKKKNH